MARPRPAKCTICRHDKRHQIEIGLVYKVPLAVLAERFSISKDALHRHRHNHLSPQVAAAILAGEKPSEIDLEAMQHSESEGLLAQLIAQRARLQVHSDMATEAGDVRSAINCERAISSNLELVAKLLGQLVTRSEIRSTSLLISPDYLQLRQILVTALQPYPEAARAVGAALAQMETKAASDITSAEAAGKPLLLEGKAIEVDE
jgi:hypothetical protein